MSEQPDDRSDQPLSLDEKLIMALGDIEQAKEAFIRQEIGDEAYDAYIARREVEKQFNDITEGIEKSPAQIVGERATEIAQQMVESGEGVSAEVDQKAMAAASREWLTGAPTEDDEYFQVDMEVQDEIAEVVNLELSLDYPGMKLVHSSRGWLTFEMIGADDITLRIVLKAVDDKLEESANYVKLEGNRPMVVASLDLTQYREFDGIVLDSFKADVLEALHAATIHLRQLSQED